MRLDRLWRLRKSCCSNRVEESADDFSTQARPDHGSQCRRIHPNLRDQHSRGCSLDWLPPCGCWSCWLLLCGLRSYMGQKACLSYWSRSPCCWFCMGWSCYLAQVVSLGPYLARSGCLSLRGSSKRLSRRSISRSCELIHKPSSISEWKAARLYI